MLCYVMLCYIIRLHYITLRKAAALPAKADPPLWGRAIFAAGRRGSFGGA